MVYEYAEHICYIIFMIGGHYMLIRPSMGKKSGLFQYKNSNFWVQNNWYFH